MAADPSCIYSMHIEQDDLNKIIAVIKSSIVGEVRSIVEENHNALLPLLEEQERSFVSKVWKALHPALRAASDTWDTLEKGGQSKVRGLHNISTGHDACVSPGAHAHRMHV